MAARLADEQALVRLHAFGVGRGVDKAELLRICAARDPATAEDRHVPTLPSVCAVLFVMQVLAGRPNACAAQPEMV
jgi:hypothetical protein